jgi:hypothetical protein
LATKPPLEFVDTEGLFMPFPLQHTTRHQAASDVMELDPLRPCLTAGQAELILAHAKHVRNASTEAIQLAPLGGWQPQAIGGIVRLAVSDHEHFQPPAQSADLRPIRVAPMVTEACPLNRGLFLRRQTRSHPSSRIPFSIAFEGYQASKSTDCG